MTKEPKIGQFIDTEEKLLVQAIENDAYKIGRSSLNADRLGEIKTAARATINEERVKVSLRVPKSDLQRLKAKALRDGLPYQTLINSILHKAVSG